MNKPTVEIIVVAGVEGPSIYIDNYRVAGNKPWGGGRELHKWQARIEDIEHAIKQASDRDREGR